MMFLSLPSQTKTILMMNIRKIVCLVTLFLCTTGMVSAQSRYSSRYGGEAGRYQRPYNSRGYYSRDSYFGLRFGYNASSLNFSSKVESDAMSGLNIGFAYGINVTDTAPLYFETGLMYSGKGATASNAALRANTRMHYVEMPLVFKYKIETNDFDLTIDPFFGGYLAMGVGGKIKYEEKNNLSSREKPNTFSKNTFSNFDAGIRLGCGLSYQQFYAEVAYDWGLANVARDKFKYFDYDNWDDTVHTGCFSVSIGVNF